MKRTVALVFLLVFSLGVYAPIRTQQATPQQSQAKEQPVYVTKSGKKYHRAGCRYLSHIKTAMSLKDQGRKGGRVHGIQRL